ncbi:MAG: hypothetical protein BMS9Abin25_0809 [Gammaproteobacteria bacterium]|nr:MAG: hypothetical protein BMS9Abin25_0809 [Gammaproteobacteria bacterium]
MKKSKRHIYLLVMLVIIASIVMYIQYDAGEKDKAIDSATITHSQKSNSKLKLYWFIPDGLRADPDVFRVFDWAKQGKLPNIKRLMENGSYGYSIPVFPGHTPSNFATLMTGTYPSLHGVVDGAIRLQGYPLQIVARNGFSSHAKLIPPIWYTLEKSGEKVSLLSVPGSTPPEISKGITIRGRWGGWGMDFPAVIFNSTGAASVRRQQGLENRLFEHGARLTQYVDASDSNDWQIKRKSFSTPFEIEMENWGTTVYGLVYDTSNDDRENYDRILLSLDRKTQWSDLAEGEGSNWLPITLHYQTANDYNYYTPKKGDWELKMSEVSVPTQLRIRIVRLKDRENFRVRFYYNTLNRYTSKPADIAELLQAAAGPMVDFPDNYPPQLVFYPEDKSAFMEEARMSLQWHKIAAAYLAESSGSTVLIHDVYTPNQFLTSRWWMRYLDPASAQYDDLDEAARKDIWQDAMEIYSGIDQIIGEVMERADENTYIVLSSDHGIIPLNIRVNLNNYLAKNGLLHYKINPETGYHKIDWDRTQVAFLKMYHIYINPKGLGGNFKRATGKDYNILRLRVINLLKELKDNQGKSPLARIVKWENAGSLGLPHDGVGDLIVSNNPGYLWSEKLSIDGKVFEASLQSGYKQGVIPDNLKGMWTPFIVMGPGIRKNHKLKKPLSHIDQYPTVLSLLKKSIPDFVQGRVISEMFETPGEE